jgi:hypothetical protein
LLPARIKLRNFFLRHFKFIGELIHLRGVFAEKFRVGEQALDAGDFGFNFVNLRFDPFKFARFFE